MNTQIEKKQKKEGTIIDLLRMPKVQQEWALVLTKYLTPERLARVAISQLKRVPKLAQCDQTSLLNALMTCAELELEPDGRRVHLIPFENRKNGSVECQLIVDYKGLIELARRSNLISNIYADVICENDEFEWDLGQVVKHKIDIRKDRGNVIGAYARMTFKDGTIQCELMSKKDIDGIRGRSKAGNFGPWSTDYNEMAKKTVLRRLLKTAPMGGKESMALEKDDDRIDFSNTVQLTPEDEEIFEVEHEKIEE
jgi:recombination protein RecT